MNVQLPIHTHLSRAEIVVSTTQKMIILASFDILILTQLVMAVPYQFTVIVVKMERFSDAPRETCATMEMRIKVYIHRDIDIRFLIYLTLSS